MKLLFIGNCSRFMNPTNSLIPAMLKLGHDVTLYGPGFCGDADIVRGLDALLDRIGGFDFVVSTRLDWSMTDANIRFYHKYTYPFYSAELLRTFGNDACSFLARTPLPKIIFLTDVDVYAMANSAADNMSASGAYFVTWADGFSKPLEELDVFNKEEFFVRKGATHKFGIWHEFAARHFSRFINLGHFVGENEFDWRGLDGRKRPAIVPGVAYHRRDVARQGLKAAGIAQPMPWLKYLMATLDRSGVRPYARPLWQQFLQKSVRARNRRCAQCLYRWLRLRPSNSEVL